MKNQLKPGAQLQLFNKQDRLCYTAGIKKIGKNSFTIYAPVCEDCRLILPPGSWWPARLIGTDALYCFFAQVLEINRDPLLNYVICSPQEVRRCQRRKYFRLSCIQNVTYWKNGEGPDWGKNVAAGIKRCESVGSGNQAVAIDLSGGGLSMVCQEFIPRQTRLLLEIALSKGKERHRLEGIVVRSTPLNYISRKRYRVGVAFNAISSGRRERIIRYLFAAMRKRINNG